MMAKGWNREKWAEWAASKVNASLLQHGHSHKLVLRNNNNKKKQKVSNMLLTAPERDIFALSLHDDGWHRHGDGDGIKVGRVRG